LPNLSILVLITCFLQNGKILKNNNTKTFIKYLLRWWMVSRGKDCQN